MKETIRINFHGAEAEVLVKLVDKILRRWYNVHGGKRLASFHDEDGQAAVTMAYTAQWDTTGFVPTLEDIVNAACKKADKMGITWSEDAFELGNWIQYLA